MNAHILALRALDQGNRVYNLGNGLGFSVRQVIDAAGKITGREIPVKLSARRAGDPAVLIASSQKIQQELGWRPRYTDIESIISTAWAWHRQHPNGYAE